MELNYEDVAEFSYQPQVRPAVSGSGSAQEYRKMKGEHVLFDEIRYFFYITTRTVAEVVRCANRRRRTSSSSSRTASTRCGTIWSDWAYMVIAALAWNIAWFALMMHRKSDRSEYIRMEFRRFIHASS